MPRVVRAHHGCWGTCTCIITFSPNAVSWEPEGPYHYSKMLHWEPEGHYNNHRLCTAIAPFYILEHIWILIVPFWLSTDDVCWAVGTTLTFPVIDHMTAKPYLYFERHFTHLRNLGVMITSAVRHVDKDSVLATWISAVAEIPFCSKKKKNLWRKKPVKL